MSTLRVILYSKQRTQRILYVDADGVMTSDIELTYRRECDVESCRPGGVRIRVNEVTRNALMALERKYDQMSEYVKVISTYSVNRIEMGFLENRL